MRIGLPINIYLGIRPGWESFAYWFIGVPAVWVASVVLLIVSAVRKGRRIVERDGGVMGSMTQLLLGDFGFRRLQQFLHSRPRRL